MTITSDTQEAISPLSGRHDRCPSWCGSHPYGGVRDGAHELDLARVWGSDLVQAEEEKLSLTLTQVDLDDAPRITVQYLPDGQIPEGFIDLPLAAAKSFRDTMDWLIAQAESSH